MRTLTPEPFPDDPSRDKDIQRRLAAMERAERLRGSVSMQYPAPRSGPN